MLMQVHHYPYLCWSHPPICPRWLVPRKYITQSGLSVTSPFHASTLNCVALRESLPSRRRFFSLPFHSLLRVSFLLLTWISSRSHQSHASRLPHADSTQVSMVLFRPLQLHRPFNRRFRYPQIPLNLHYQDTLQDGLCLNQEWRN